MCIYIYTIILSRDIEIHVCISIQIYLFIYMYVHIYTYISYFLIIYSYMPLPEIYDGIVVLSVQKASLLSNQHILLLASIAIDPQQKAPLRTN